MSVIHSIRVYSGNRCENKGEMRTAAKKKQSMSYEIHMDRGLSPEKHDTYILVLQQVIFQSFLIHF